MAKCKDCLHYEACLTFSKIINAARDVEKGCEHFKDRTEVAEVVRCKDCIHRQYVDFGDDIGAIGGCGLFGTPMMTCDDFCSYGERRAGE